MLSLVMEAATLKLENVIVLKFPVINLYFENFGLLLKFGASAWEHFGNSFVYLSKKSSPEHFSQKIRHTTASIECILMSDGFQRFTDYQHRSTTIIYIHMPDTQAKECITVTDYAGLAKKALDSHLYHNHLLLHRGTSMISQYITIS